MRAQELTPELKNDLRALQLRSAIDPKQHYKANDSKELPKYFQVCVCVCGGGGGLLQGGLVEYAWAGEGGLVKLGAA